MGEFRKWNIDTFWMIRLENIHNDGLKIFLSLGEID